MKNIAIRSRSLIRKNFAYTTPGVGDRLHSALIGIQYAKAHNTKVVLHLTSDKYGKQHKKDSWAEICQMSGGLVSIEVHDACNLPETDWIAYLKNKGIEAQTYYYADTLSECPLGKVDGLDLIDAGKYLTKLPELNPIGEKLDFLPEKYITVQWDTTDKSRQLSPLQILKIENDYNLPAVIVGGSSRNELLKTSLIAAGNAIANSEYYVGIDSGFFHLAQYYLPYDKIDIYSIKRNVSHHVVRSKRHGIMYNRFLNGM